MHAAPPQHRNVKASELSERAPLLTADALVDESIGVPAVPILAELNVERAIPSMALCLSCIYDVKYLDLIIYIS